MKDRFNLPKDWNLFKLKKLVDFENGKAHEDCAQENGNYKLVNSRFISTRGEIVKFSDEIRSPLQVGDLTMVMSDVPNGKALASCFLINEDNAYTLNQRICRLRPNKMDSKFLYYFLNRNTYYLRFDNGVSQTNLRKNEVLDCPIAYPPLPEQKAIAALLSTWDEAIEKTERLIQTKGKKLNALYQSYFRVDSSTTKSWEPVKVGKFVTPRNEKAVPTEEQPLYSLTIENGITEKTERYNREFLVKDTGNKTYKVVHPGDIVFNPANLRWGAIARSTVDHKVVLSPIYEVLQIKDNAIDPDFLTHALTCPRQIAIYATKTEGTLIERMAVKLDAFLLLKIRAPSSISEQKEIAKTLSNAQHEIDLLKQLADKYKTQKRGLMQKMLTGEWRIKLEIVNQYMEA